jgi:hypothetical protein
MMGADLCIDRAVHDFVTGLIDPDEVEVTLYLWTPARLRRDAKCIEDEDRWIKLAGDDLEEGKSIFVAFRSRGKLETCMTAWRKRVPPDRRRFMAISSKTDKEAARVVLQDVDGWYARGEADGLTCLLAVSPSVTVGVDIQYPVDRVYGNAKSQKSCDARTFAQSLNRPRGPKDKVMRIFLGPRPSDKAREFLTSSGLRRRLARSLEVRGNSNRIFVDRVTGAVRLIDDGISGVSDAVLRDACITLDVEEARSEGAHVSDALVRVFQLKGMEIVPDDPPAPDDEDSDDLLEVSDSDDGGGALDETFDRALIEATVLAELRSTTPVPDIPECTRQYWILSQKRKSETEELTDQESVLWKVFRTMDRYPGLGRWPTDPDELEFLNVDAFYPLSRALFLRKDAATVDARDAKSMNRSLVLEKTFMYSIVDEVLAETMSIISNGDTRDHSQLNTMHVSKSRLESDAFIDIRGLGDKLDNNGYRRVVLKNGRAICHGKKSKHFTSNKTILQGILRQVGHKLGPGKRKRARGSQVDRNARETVYPIIKDPSIWIYEFAHCHAM